MAIISNKDEPIEISSDDEVPAVDPNMASQRQRHNLPITPANPEDIIVIISDSDDTPPPPRMTRQDSVRVEANEAQRAPSPQATPPAEEPFQSPLFDVDPPSPEPLPQLEPDFAMEIEYIPDPEETSVPDIPEQSPGVTEGPPSIRTSPEAVSTSDSPPLRVKYILYGGVDGFFKDAWDSLRTQMLRVAGVSEREMSISRAMSLPGVTGRTASEERVEISPMEQEQVLYDDAISMSGTPPPENQLTATPCGLKSHSPVVAQVILSHNARYRLFNFLCSFEVFQRTR